MSVLYHDPRAEPLAPAQPYQLEADFSQPPTIALLANGFPDSVAFLQAVEKALAAELPAARFRHYDKGNASQLVTDDMLQDIVAECSVVVSAYGH